MPKTKTVKGLEKREYMAVCKEMMNFSSGRKVKSCTQRWKKGLEP